MYIFNGRIYTMDPERPFVSALAVESGRIKAIGSDQEILGEFCGLMRGEDLKGKTVLPGSNGCAPASGALCPFSAEN